jgi:hypothetical protein
MSDHLYQHGWLSLQNPFSKISKQVSFPSTIGRDLDTSEAIIGRVSGRRTDITRIITNEQSAIFLMGTPNIGKSTFIRYLQEDPDIELSWRDELTDLRDQFKLQDIHFVQIDLTPLEDITEPIELLNSFVRQCMKALMHAYRQENLSSLTSTDLKELRGLLRTINRETPDTRYFVMFDSIERLGMLGMRSLSLESSSAQTPQERGLALLDRCGAIRTLVDLIDEFIIFGVILSVESLPRPKIDDQFQHVSLDLARFTTMILQAFTWDETAEFLAQGPANFGNNWAEIFKAWGGNYIFSRSEQEWLRQLAGTHPYLLQQLCLNTFRYKQEYANIHRIWPELQERDKAQLGEMINESLSPFLAHVGQRLKEVIEKSIRETETKSKFYEFIRLLEHKRADEEMDSTLWYELGSELRYILYSEGIVRYDRLRPIHFPGSILSQYLTKWLKASKESSERVVSLPSTTGRNVTISRPGFQPVIISLSDLEYRLLKKLMQYPERCNESELMKGAWGTLIERSRFTQRVHQLRKKLRDQSAGTEIIENSYGGFYSLNHPEWLQLQ